MSEEFRKIVEFTKDRVARKLETIRKELDAVEREVDNDLLSRGGPEKIIALGGVDFYHSHRSSLIAIKAKVLKEAQESLLEIYSDLDLALRNTA